MHNFINYTFQFLGLLVALLGVVVAILINWKEIKKTLKRKDVKNIKHKVNLSRRGVIKGLGAIAVGAMSWGIIQIKPIQESIKKALYYFLPQGKNLVVNTKSGVIHHSIICSDHLPSEHNISSTPAIVPNSKFHSTHKVAILTKITEGASAEDAIEVLLLAAEDNPSSVHIYDKIVKLLGKLKRYESIHLLLENAEKNLVNIARKSEEGSKEQRKYKKAISHMQLQRKQAKNRAKYSAINMG